MPNCANLTPDSRFFGLFIGRSGSGKTPAACSFPGRVKDIDFDGRIRTLLNCPWVDKAQVDYDYYPPKVKDGDPTYIKLNKDLEALLTSCRVGQNPYQTIVFDSVTNACFALVSDAIPLTHAAGKGKSIGAMPMPGPEDYGFEANGIYSIMSFLKSIPIQNIIITAHIVDRFGRLDPNDKYSERVPIGEKLSIRDKIGENILTNFDHVFKFEKDIQGNRPVFTVTTQSEICRTAYPNLPTQFDITGKNFFETMMKYVKG